MSGLLVAPMMKTDLLDSIASISVKIVLITLSPMPLPPPDLLPLALAICGKNIHAYYKSDGRECVLMRMDKDTREYDMYREG